MSNSLPPVELAICCTVRNEARYIAEWLAFHRLVGVERFYLYDDGSDDDTMAICRTDRDVVVTPWGPGRNEYACPVACPYGSTHQTTAHNHFLRTYGQFVRWCAFIDVDEYLYHATEDDLRKTLAGHKESALWVPWLFFGQNGHKTRPVGLTIENYTRRGALGEPVENQWGLQGKVIAQPAKTKHFGLYGSHNAAYRSGCAVDENGHVVPAFINPNPTANLWRLNHYYHRSEEEARERVNAIDNNCGISINHKTLERMSAHDLNHTEDRDILRFLPALHTTL